MYSADGFVKSTMASLESSFKAYDQAALARNNGVLDKSDFVKPEQKFYSEAFDADGVIKPGYAKFASEEIALNANNDMVSWKTAMERFLIMKSIFMFPRTKANALSVVQTFDPTGATALWRDKSWRAMTANAGDYLQSKEIL